jgi:hypothetical protein
MARATNCGDIQPASTSTATCLLHRWNIACLCRTAFALPDSPASGKWSQAQVRYVFETIISCPTWAVGRDMNWVGISRQS